MYRLNTLLVSICLVAGSFIPIRSSDLEDEGPARTGAFVAPNGSLVYIDAGDVGLYPTGAYDDLIDCEKDVKFFLFTIDNMSDGQQMYLNNETSVHESNIDASRPTKVVIHGFLNNLESPVIQLIKDAFLENFNYNVIAVDWSAIASNILYTVVVSEVPAVGHYVGEFINFLHETVNIQYSDVHIIGHSLGAHVSGFAGKKLHTLGYNASRITGLDPALPGYSKDSTTTRLASSDAQYVDCIHTCAGFLGFLSPICQSDFYPNGGKDPQPGCILDLFGACSHGKSYRYYAASINETNAFLAEECDSFTSGTLKGCSNSDDALMGYPAGVDEPKGDYYLKTTADYPYAEST